MTLIRFGVFEVDTRSHELLRHGSKIKLQDQPFQVLALLLEHPGELVTREELIKRLWPDDTFVDFESGLNKAVNRLRAALRDSAEKPRFIETLPQRGYRFIGQIENSVIPTAAADRDRGGLVAASIPRIDSLAVLPLDNLSGDPSEDYFSDGMTEELITAISKISTLRVISRTSVMRYKGARKSLRAIAKELRVGAVVEGSVARSNQKVRITAQLIYAADDRHLWSGRYERELRDVLQLQDDIAQDIASRIHAVVDPERSSAPVRRVNPQAYEACLKGNFIRDKMTPVDLAKSAHFYKQAIDLDPGYAAAHANLSQCYFYQGVFGMGPPSELFLKAKASAIKALELDETSEAHNALAVVHILYDWDWPAAEAECKRALQLNPNDATTRIHLADYMSIRARHEEAIAQYKLALELDPISCMYVGFFGLILQRARRYEESIEQCHRALDLDPNYPNALWFLALSLEQVGRLEEATARLERAVSISPAPYFRALLARAYALAGERLNAESILGELKELSQQAYVSPFDIAIIHSGLGNVGATFEWLEKAYQERVFRIIELTLPMFDNLRPDPRWQDIVGRLGLTTA